MRPRPTDPPDRRCALLRRCADGELSAPVTLMQLLIEAGSVDRVARIIGSAPVRAEAAACPDGAAKHRLDQLRRLLAENRPGLRRVAAMLRDGLDHTQTTTPPDAGPDAAIERCRAMFDRLVRHSPEASVALYSLGSPDLLDAATGEVVDGMRAWGLIAPDRRLLEIGCGIGRFEVALADKVAAITGIDISGEMIAAARRRCAGLRNVHLRQCSGRDLSPFGDAAFDLVLAVDTLPYVMQAGGLGLVERHVREAARVLKPRGDLLILNLSYRDDPRMDRSEIVGLAADTGLTVVRNGTRAFALWDGLAFHLKRDAPPATAGPFRPKQD